VKNKRIKQKTKQNKTKQQLTAPKRAAAEETSRSVRFSEVMYPVA
jgi:hypothetical protein